MNRRLLGLGLLLFTVGVLAGAAVVHFGTRPPAEQCPPVTVPNAVVASASTQSLEGIRFSPAPQDTGATAELLPSGTAAVYAFYFLSELPHGSLPKAAWRFNGTPLRIAGSGEVQADGGRPGHGMVVLHAAGGKLAPGAYELQLQTDRRKLSASFVAAPEAQAVLAQPAPAEAALALTQHVLARGVGKDGSPSGPTSTFTQTERVHYVLRYRGAEPGMAVRVTWWAGKTEIKAAGREVVLPAAEGWAHAWMQAQDGLPAGTYTVRAATSGDTQALATDSFTVR